MSYLNRWVPNRYLMTALIALICLIFIFLSGTGADFLPSSDAGAINGEKVTYTEFQKAYQRLHDSYSRQLKDPEMMKRFPLHDFAFNQIVSQKILLQAAKKYDLQPTEEAVRDYIRKMPAFQVAGRFSKLTYEDTLRSNGMSLAGFEKEIRDFLTTEHVRNFFEEGSRVTQREIEEEYLLLNETRKIKYTVIKSEQGQKDVEVSSAEIEAYLSDPNKSAVAQARFDNRKTTDYKGKTFAQVKNDIARDLLAGQQVEKVQKAINDLAEKVKELLKANKSNDAKIEALLKRYGATIQETTALPQSEKLILPSLGEIEALKRDAFSPGNELLQNAKIYTQPGGVAVAIVTEVKHADLSKLNETEREKMKADLLSSKGRRFSDWHQKLSETAKVVKNPEIVKQL